MKRLLISIGIGFFFLLTACGTAPIKHDPPHLKIGMGQIKKGIERYQKGCYGQALTYFYRAHERFAASDQVLGVAMSLNNLGNVYRHMGDFDKAIGFFDEAYALYDNLKDMPRARQVLSNKAAALIGSTRLAEAEKTLQHVATLGKPDEKPFIPLWHNQSVLLIKQKKMTEAEALLQKALKHTSASRGAKYAAASYVLGTLLIAKNNSAEAILHLNEALAIDRKAGFYKGIADDLAALGDAYAKKSDHGIATEYYKRSIKIYALIDNSYRLNSVAINLKKNAAKAKLDLSVTNHFIKAWSKGRALTDPCN
jgi:tetratricopeptide (TPR) repeat protein